MLSESALNFSSSNRIPALVIPFEPCDWDKYSLLNFDGVFNYMLNIAGSCADISPSLHLNIAEGVAEGISKMVMLGGSWYSRLFSESLTNGKLMVYAPSCSGKSTYCLKNPLAVDGDKLISEAFPRYWKVRLCVEYFMSRMKDPPAVLFCWHNICLSYQSKVFNEYEGKAQYIVHSESCIKPDISVIPYPHQNEKYSIERAKQGRFLNIFGLNWSWSRDLKYYRYLVVPNVFNSILLSSFDQLAGDYLGADNYISKFTEERERIGCQACHACRDFRLLLDTVVATGRFKSGSQLPGGFCLPCLALSGASSKATATS